jgi:hypothetical protein
MTVTSSEKSDTSGNYDRFSINAMPYPGCEFFRDFRDHGHSGNDLSIVHVCFRSLYVYRIDCIRICVSVCECLSVRARARARER